MMRSLFLAVLILCPAASITGLAGDTVPGSRLTTIEVAVTEKGKPVLGMSHGDFQVFLDGKEQRILSFQAVQGTLEAATAQTGEVRFGKTVMILFDAHAMTNAQAQIAQTAAEKYVSAHMRAQDLFAVAVYGRSLEIIQNFTNDPQKVTAAVRRPITAFGATRLERGFSGEEGLQLGRNVLLSLRSLCEDLSQVRGVKSVLVFSQDFFAPGGEQFSRLVEAARRAKVSFYTLITTQASAERQPGGRPAARQERADERSLRPASETAWAFSGFAGGSLAGSSVSSLLPEQQQQGGPPASTPTGPTGSGIADPSLREDISKADQIAINSDVLQALAKETNGDYVRESNNLTKALGQFEVFLGNYYVLGFVPSSAADRHKVEVKSRRKGVRLSYSRTLYPFRLGPIDPATARKLSSALESNAAAGTSALRAKPAVLKLERDLFEVVFYLEPETGSEAAAVAAMTWGEDGKPAGYFQAVQKGNDAGISPVTMALRPGKYRVRIAMADREGGMKVTEQQVRVPDFPDDEMRAGELLVAAQIKPLPGLLQAVPPSLIEGHPLVFKGYEITPSIDNRSPREKPLPLFFHLFNLRDPSASSELVSDPRLTDQNGQTFLLPPVRHARTADVGAKGTVTLGFSVPVSNLNPGKYHLTIHTRGPAGTGPVICETEVFLE